MKIIAENNSADQEIKFDIQFKNTDLVFPKSEVIVSLGIPYSIIIILTILKSVIFSGANTDETLNLIFSPIVLILVGFTFMCLIGLYYVYIWHNRFRFGRDASLTINPYENTVYYTEKSSTGFYKALQAHYKYILFSKSVNGADGWSIILYSDKHTQINLFTVNDDNLEELFNTASKIKSFLKDNNQINQLRFSESFLKNKAELSIS